MNNQEENIILEMINEEPSGNIYLNLFKCKVGGYSHGLIYYYLVIIYLCANTA